MGPLQADFARWCDLQSKIAHANSDYEMACLINQANRIEEHWAHGSHAAKWFRLQGSTPRYTAHIAGEQGESEPGVYPTVEMHPAADLVEALAWGKFRLEHIADVNLSFSINRTGAKKPIYTAHGSARHIADEVLHWQHEQEKRPA